MRKSILILLLLLCLGVNAQDSVPSDPPKIKWMQKDIKVDNDTVSQKKFEKDFDRRYRTDEFVYKEKAAEKTAWDRFKEWFSSLMERLFRLNGEKASDVTDIVLKTLAVLICIFVTYLIVKSILNKEGQWVFGRSSAKKIIRHGDIEKNLQAVNFEALIAETMQTGDKRLAVRYYYLWLLKKFSERSIITWDIEKTNSDYLYEIRNEQHKNEFAYLSYLYNHIWYGEFEPDEASFGKAVRAFEKTIRSA